MRMVEEFIDASEHAGSEAKLKSLFLSTLKTQGYENAVFARVGNRRLTSIPWSEFPSGYLDVYKARNWDKIDPVVQRIQTARGPFQWNETYSRNGLSAKQREFFGNCRELGVHSGMTIPIHGPGREVDLISVSFREREKAPIERKNEIYLLSVQYWLKYIELADRREVPVPTLTGQELDCLRWCKEGKTNWEIGEILDISEKTVEFHLTNTMRKLGASNRLSAVIVGIKAGLICL